MARSLRFDACWTKLRIVSPEFYQSLIENHGKDIDDDLLESLKKRDSACKPEDDA